MCGQILQSPCRPAYPRLIDSFICFTIFVLLLMVVVVGGCWLFEWLAAVTNLFCHWDARACSRRPCRRHFSFPTARFDVILFVSIYLCFHSKKKTHFSQWLWLMVWILHRHGLRWVKRTHERRCIEFRIDPADDAINTNSRHFCRFYCCARALNTVSVVMVFNLGAGLDIRSACHAEREITFFIVGQRFLWTCKMRINDLATEAETTSNETPIRSASISFYLSQKQTCRTNIECVVFWPINCTTHRNWRFAMKATGTEIRNNWQNKQQMWRKSLSTNTDRNMEYEERTSLVECLLDSDSFHTCQSAKYHK